MNYVLITPVRNEEAFIEKTLASVVAQSLLPARWVIVDDGSTDRTAEIIQRFADQFLWIDLFRRSPRKDRSFSGKVAAFNAGLERVNLQGYEVLGNLDGDLSFESDYMEFLLLKFANDPKLGVAGTPFIENGYDSATDSFEGRHHVAGGCQLFRRECFAQIGGYTPNRAGGIDWMAVTTARMMGWRTESFPEKRFHHYRPLGTAQAGMLGALFSYGEKDYYLGGSPIWQLFRVSYRAIKRPFLIGGMALLAGYCWAALKRVRRPVSPELMRFHRQEQMSKLRCILRSLVTRRPIDNFTVASHG